MEKKRLPLAIYKLASDTSMSSYDLWRQQVWLPENMRLSGEKISEILSSVTKDNLVDYFKLRHERHSEIRKKQIESQPELKGCKIEYALDSTSISTYSNTNSFERVPMRS